MSESRKRNFSETTCGLEAILTETNNLTEVLKPIVMDYLHKADLEFDEKQAAALTPPDLELEEEKTETKAQPQDHSQRYKNSFHYQHKQSFFNNFVLSLESKAAHIAHNLAWNVNIDETLKFAKENPESLLVKIEIKDAHGQRYYNTPLKILLSLGERNPFKCEPGIDFGLAERLVPCFADPLDAKNQIDEWENESKEKQNGTGEKEIKTATDITMAPYKKAIDDLCTAIIENKELTDDTPWGEALFNLKIATDFKDKLKPNPNHVVKAGFSWDIQIFLDFFKVWEDKVKQLGGWYSLKSDLFGTIVYSSLQARMSRGDLCILSKGLDNVVNTCQIPERFNFVNGIPERLRDVGDFWFGLSGNKYGSALVSGGLCALDCRWPFFFKTWFKQKLQPWNYATFRASLTLPEMVRDTVASNSNLAANSAVDESQHDCANKLSK